MVRYESAGHSISDGFQGYFIRERKPVFQSSERGRHELLGRIFVFYFESVFISCRLCKQTGDLSPGKSVRSIQNDGLRIGRQRIFKAAVSSHEFPAKPFALPDVRVFRLRHVLLPESGLAGRDVSVSGTVDRTHYVAAGGSRNIIRYFPVRNPVCELLPELYGLYIYRTVFRAVHRFMRTKGTPRKKYGAAWLFYAVGYDDYRGGVAAVTSAVSWLCPNRKSAGKYRSRKILHSMGNNYFTAPMFRGTAGGHRTVFTQTAQKK